MQNHSYMQGRNVLMAASYVVKYALAFYLEKENDKLNKDKNIMAFENQGSC